MNENELIQIDVRKVLESKLGAKMKYVPDFVVKWLSRTICQDQINDKLRRYHPLRDAEFCHKAKEDFGVSLEVKNAERLPDYDHRRIIIVSNHPLGGLDGILLISELSRRYGNGIKFIVNDLLAALRPLSGVFLPINKHGRQSRESIEAINRAMEGDDPVVIFPAGLVSRRGKNGEIKDLQWHKMFVSKAIQYRRDVLPIFFSGENSQSFYKLAQWRKRLGLKFNIEMIYLPRELMRAHGKHFSVNIGEIVPWRTLAAENDHLASAQKVKEMTYSLK